MKQARAGTFFSRILAKPETSPRNIDIGESVIGKTFSPDLFREELKDLGYDFKVYVDKDNRIYKFTRFTAPAIDENGDVW